MLLELSSQGAAADWPRLCGAGRGADRTMSMATVVASVRLLMAGPTTNTGWMVTRSIPFSLASAHAAFSASVLLTGYGSTSTVLCCSADQTGSLAQGLEL